MSFGEQIYQIRIEGRVGLDWSVWIEGVKVQFDDRETILTASFPDQTALHGALMKIRDLGVPLIEARRIEIQPNSETMKSRGESNE